MRKLDFSQIDRPFLYASLGLLICGLLFLASASGPVAFTRFGSNFFFIQQQLLQGFLPGLFAAAMAYVIPLRVWRAYAVPMLGISVILLSLVFVPGLGSDFGTFAKSWIVIGGFSFQPAELVKITFLFYLAAWVAERGDHLKDFEDGFLPFLVVLGIIGGLIYLQPDLGTLSIIIAMAFIVFFVAGGSTKHLVSFGFLSAAFFALAIRLAPYRAERFMTFLYPELDPQGVGYQINQALLAIGSGGFLGRGYGRSIQKFQYLPEVIGDSIFAVVAEELGFVFTLMFLALLVFWLARALKIAENTSDLFSRYVVTGIVAWVGVQAFMNILAIIGLMPLTGVPLPFVSYGGTAMTVTLFCVGVILQVSNKGYGKRA